MKQKNRIKSLKNIYSSIDAVPETSYDLGEAGGSPHRSGGSSISGIVAKSGTYYDFYEPKNKGRSKGILAYRYYETSDEFQLIDAPACEGVGEFYGKGTYVYKNLKSSKESWIKFPFNGGSCVSDYKPINKYDVEPELEPGEGSHPSDDYDLFADLQQRRRRLKEMAQTGSLISKNPDFAAVKTVEPGGRQLVRFGGSNWRYQQPTLGEIKWFIENGVDNFIRLSGDGSGDIIKDPQTGLRITIDVQKRFTESFGATFKRMSAHSGYRYGKGYTKTIANTNAEFSGGNTLVHCRWGADRTGYVVAAYLKETGEMTNLEDLWNYTVKYNRWEKKICKDASNTGYAKYLDGFYPIPKFCASSRHKDCDVCNRLPLK